MKRKSYFIGLICLALVFGLFAAPVQATPPTLSLETTTNGSTSATAFAQGQDIYLNIVSSDNTGVAGAALTINYPSVLDPPVIDAAGLSANITSPLFTAVTVGQTTEDMRRANSLTTGKILLSGAAIHATNGGAKINVGGVLFTLIFKVKTDATIASGYNFSLTATNLNNTAAGYAAGGEDIPLLIGAVPNTDTANWGPDQNGYYSNAFPVLLSALSSVPSATFEISSVPPNTVAGTVNYSGSQTGNLKVAAFSNSTLTSTVGSGFSGTWSGTSKAYSISVPGGGSYYIAAYIDSGATPNGSRDAWEAQGLYPSNPLTVSADLTGKDITLADPDVNSNGLPDWWEVKYSLYNETSPIDKNADYDNDGYSNLVEYQNGKNPTVADAPGGTGYNPTLDTRSYTITGTISYGGSQVGTLKVAAFAPADSTFGTVIGTDSQVAWSGASKTYSLTVPNGTYVVAAFIDSANIGTRDPSEAQGTSSLVTVAGASATKDFALIDSSTATHKIFFAGSTSLGMNGQGKFTLKSEIPDGKTLKAFNIEVSYDTAMLTLVTPVAPATNPTKAANCPAALVPANINTVTAGKTIFNGFSTIGQVGPLTFDWMDFTFAGKGTQGSTAITIVVSSYGTSSTDQFKPKIESFDLNLVVFNRGDADGSGSVDIFDALIVAEYDAQLKAQNDLPGFSVADVDDSGGVDIFDALKIAEFDAGLIPNLN